VLSQIQEGKKGTKQLLISYNKKETMSTLKEIGNKLFKEDLASQKVELFNIEDTIKLYDKGINDLKFADAEKTKLAQLYSRALIILEFNVPAQFDDSIKKLNELGISDKANELKALKDKSLKKAAEYKKLYDSLK
jgi:hypothetical protein